MHSQISGPHHNYYKYVYTPLEFLNGVPAAQSTNETVSSAVGKIGS